MIIFGPDTILFIGPLGRVGWHRHAAPAIVCGLEVPVAVAASTGVSHHRVAFVPAGLSHAPDFGGGLSAVLYFQPASARAKCVATGMAQNAITTIDECDAWMALFKVCASRPASQGRACLEAGIAKIMSSTSLPIDAGVDPRIARIIENASHAMLSTSPPTRRLSPSRLRHLFVEQTGVPRRRFKVWLRLQHAALAALSGQSLTIAAIDAGFSDQAHFSRAFRDMFGLAPSRVLKPNVDYSDGRKRTHSLD